MTNPMTTSMSSQSQSERCPISLESIEDLKKSGNLVSTSCEHKFSKEHILTWMKDHSKCPICRRQIGTLTPIITDTNKVAQKQFQDSSSAIKPELKNRDISLENFNEQNKRSSNISNQNRPIHNSSLPAHDRSKQKKYINALVKKIYAIICKTIICEFKRTVNRKGTARIGVIFADRTDAIKFSKKSNSRKHPITKHTSDGKSMVKLGLKNLTILFGRTKGVKVYHYVFNNI